MLIEAIYSAAYDKWSYYCHEYFLWSTLGLCWTLGFSYILLLMVLNETIEINILWESKG